MAEGMAVSGIDGRAGAQHEKIVSLVEASVSLVEAGCGPEVADLEFSTVAGDQCSFLLDVDDSVDDLFNLLAREHGIQPYQLKLVLPSQGVMKYREVYMNIRTLLLEAYKDQDICVKALTTQILPRAEESREKTEDGRLSVRPDGRCGLRCVAHAVGTDAVNTALKAWDLYVNTTEGLDLLNGTDLATLIVLRNLRIAALSRLQQELAVCYELRVIVDGCFPDGHFGTFDDWLAMMLTKDDSIHDYSNLWALGAGEVLFIALAFIFKARIVRTSYYPTGPCGLQQPSGRICDAAPVVFNCDKCIHLAQLHNSQNEGLHFDLLRLSGLDPDKLPSPERLPQPPKRPVRRTAPRSARTF